MRTTRHAAILVVVAGLVGQAGGQNSQVELRGTVMTAEAHDVMPICYGDYHVTVTIDTIVSDPNHVLTDIRSVVVCYGGALGLAAGDSVEVNGYYWGGICPRQYCGHVQILMPSDYVRPAEGYGDNDWMVRGDNLYSIPRGNVGIGAGEPREKLHVVGNVLVEGASPAWLKLLGTLGNDVGVGLTTSGMGVNTWEIFRKGSSADLQITERFPYPPALLDRVVIKAGTGNVGIGTMSPAEKLHVSGTALVEGTSSAQLDEALRVVKEGTGRQLVAYFLNPKDGAAETELQLAGGKSLPWGWSLRAASGSFTIANVATLPPPLTLTNTGYLGAGVTSPTYRLELPNTAGTAGQGRANAWKTYSSGRWKTHVRTLENAMDKVRQLRGVSFEWKDSGVRDIGMIAEEVGQVVPEIVDYEANGADARALAYDRLVAVLVEAVKQQDARITELEQALARRDRLEQRLEALERLIEQQRASVSGVRTLP